MKIDKIIKVISIPLMLGLVFTTSNCTYKNAQDVYPVDTSGCVTANMSFARDIQPILIANCYSCHSTKNAALGLGYILDSYALDTLYVRNGINGPSMYGNVSDPNVSDFYHMPKGLPSISACEILKIKAWIDQGYKNN